MSRLSGVDGDIRLPVVDPGSSSSAAFISKMKTRLQNYRLWAQVNIQIGCKVRTCSLVYEGQQRRQAWCAYHQNALIKFLRVTLLGLPSRVARVGRNS